jgi:TolB-like protein
MSSQQWTSAATIQAELARILKSPLFAHAKRQRRFLEFIVTETLAGRADRISSYSLSVEVFDRDESFDPMLDSVVRVGAGRLRAKLREYYDDEGQANPIRIGLEKGSYVATICKRRFDPAEGAGQTPVEPEKPSLAVLPFASEGEVPGHHHFVDGLTEDVITDLSKLSGLFLVSRHASHTYERTQQPPETIARKLGVHYLLEGNLRLAGGRVRVSAQLIDALSSQVLWGERYDRELGDDFNVQDDLARNIVRAISCFMEAPDPSGAALEKKSPRYG